MYRCTHVHRGTTYTYPPRACRTCRVPAPPAAYRATRRYQEIQTKYKNKYRDRVERQLRIVKPTATKLEIEQAVEGGEQSEIFTQQFLQGPGLASNAQSWA